jgi:lipid II:glycine glycyltransferase (peptidoglycan interpeptide bridge formation enzyme)
MNLGIKNPDWQELLAESPYSNAFQTEEMYNFLSSLGCLRSFLSCVRNAEGKLVGLAVGYIQAEKGIKKHFSRRAIIQGGLLLAKDIAEDELKTLLEGIKKKTSSAIYVEIRNNADYSQYKEVFEKYGFEYRPHLNCLIDCSDADQALKNMNESRRRQVRIATEGKYEVKMAETEAEVDEFYKLLSAHYKNKVKKPIFPKEFFAQILAQKIGEIMLIKINGKVVSGMLQLCHGNTVYDYYVFGLDTQYPNNYPSVLVYWETIKRASALGYTTFDTMGAGIPGQAYGVRDFKLRFGSRLVEHGRFLSINKPLLYKLGTFAIMLISR